MENDVNENVPLNQDVERQPNENLRSGVAWKDYKAYIDAGYGTIGSGLLLLYFIIVQFGVVLTDLFVSNW